MSPCLRVARREARRSRIERLLLLLRNSIFKLLSKVLIDLINSCCRLGGGRWLLGDGTGFMLDEGGFGVAKGGGLNAMVDGENSC